jgi:hypothetical protein
MAKVRVNQKDGEITITGTETRTWTVHNHIAEVKETDLDLFLRGTEGKVIESKPDSGKAGE